MSSAVPPTQSLEPDPFRYGWRDVRRTRPAGTEEWARVPLTLLDVLHPQEEDRIRQDSWHERQRRYLMDVLGNAQTRDPRRLVLSNCLIDWDCDDLRPHCPDLIVLERDAPWPRRSWNTLHVRRELARPLLVIEVVSPHTRSNDVVEKLQHYHRAGVPLYILADRELEAGPIHLLGYRHGPGGYGVLSPDGDGRVPLEAFGLSLALIEERLVVFDAVADRELLDYAAAAQALKAIQEQTRQHIRAALEAEHRTREHIQATQEAERRWREEVTARLAVEARIRVLEAELQRLRGPAE